MRTRLLLMMILCFVLSACATTANYEALLNTWLNNDINALVSSWGYPSGTFTAPNGNTVYVYESGGSFTLPTTYQTTASVYGYGNTAYGTARTNVYGGQTVTLWCRTFFEINSSKRIVRWSWEGNNCKSRYKPEERIDQQNYPTETRKTDPAQSVISKSENRVSVTECDEQKAMSIFNSKYSGGESERYTHKTHFNGKLKQCFMYVQRNGKASMPDKEEILDINEDRYYGQLRVTGGAVVCVIKDKLCKGKDEWNTFLKDIMEE